MSIDADAYGARKAQVATIPLIAFYVQSEALKKLSRDSIMAGFIGWISERRPIKKQPIERVDSVVG
ncbi:hypothetical protein DXT77_02880 [Pseudomonas sp. 91RF]|uniref:hypothetical protein n=1 Tax=Pseudomonas sp. 91RF TaxID=2292261 RepID=UPI000E675450|nr:hypothetical protein [Pseudomonas sp. 91RF]RIJ12820.1 hypothetical protein DXT77_02880 [Pseudomonas sp. 91RF]